MEDVDLDGRASILVVEDDPGLSELIGDLLRDNGWAVQQVLHGEAAQASLCRQAPTLLLLDYSLPDMTAAQFVTETPGLPPFIVVTGAGDERIAVDMMKRGARDYLVKDAHFLDVLPLAVKSVLDQINTEQQLARAQHALRESEERYRRLFEDAVLGIFQSTPDGKILNVNPAFARMFGYDSPAEVMSRVTDVARDVYVDPSRRPNVVQMIMGSHAPVRVENRYRRKDGSTFVGHLHAWAVWGEDGEFRYLEGFVEDITERKQAEESLRASEERQRLFLENFTGIAYQSDVNERTPMLLWGMVTEISGYHAADFVSSVLTWLQIVHPDDFPRVQEESRRLREGLDPAIDSEYRIVHRNGETRWVRDIRRRVADRSGASDRIQGAVYDVTERKRLEEERLEMERRLLRSQKLESLGVLAGGIAHDFNNLLTAILGNVDLALMDLSPLSPARPSLEYAVQATRRAADLTRQMLAYSGRGRFVVKRLDLSELVEENAHLLRASIAKSVTLNLDLQRGLPPITADAAQLQQVVMNLITNASEAIRDEVGIIRLCTGVQDCDADCLSRSRQEEKPAPGRFVYVEVADTGCGMDDDTQQRLFDPFYTTKEMGRGLGLSAVLGIVRGHRGAVFVDSAVGQGTTMRVLFPEAKVEPGEANQRGAATSPRTGDTPPAVLRGTMLVVDDEQPVRELCRRWMERLGFVVLTAADGEEAVEVFRQHADRIVLVLLDLSMPRLDGLAAFKAMRAIRPNVRVILSSGYDEQEATLHFQGEGLAGFVQKPFRLEPMRAAVERALSSEQ